MLVAAIQYWKTSTAGYPNAASQSFENEKPVFKIFFTNKV